MNGIVFLILTIIFFFSPYQRGLFFDFDLYMIEGVIGLVFIGYSIWILTRDDKHDVSIYLIIFCIPLLYLVSIFGAESPKFAMDNLFRWLLYASFFICLIWVRMEENYRASLPHVFHLTGLYIVTYAMFGLWGWVEFQDLLLGTRLTGFFQYANTFAAVMAAFWLYSLIVLTRKQLSVSQSIYFALPLVAYGASILLSDSRGAFVVIPFAWFIGLCLLSVKKQVTYLLYTCFSLLGSFIAYQSVTGQMKEKQITSPGLTALVVSSVAVILIVALIQRIRQGPLVQRFDRLNQKRSLRFVLPVVSIVFSVLLFLDLTNKGLVYKQLPDQLQARLDSVNFETSSVLGRQAFYIDGLAMSKDAPLFGFGGNGWRVLFTHYQHQPYWSNQTHNGYLETLLNIGWVGLIVFVLVLAFLIFQIFKRIREERGNDVQLMTIATIPALAMIFIHSFIDFNFSYGTIWLIIIWLMAMGVSDHPLPKRAENKQGIWKIPLGLVIIFVAVFDVYSWRFLRADNQLAQADWSVDADQAIQFLERSHANNPYELTSLSKLADFYIQEFYLSGQMEYKSEVIDILKKLEQLEPHNPKVLFELSDKYAKLDELEKAVQYIDKALQLDRFNVMFYDYSIKLKTSIAEFYLEQGATNQAQQMAKASIDDLETYHTLFDPYREIQIPDMRKIDLAPETYHYLEDAFDILE